MKALQASAGWLAGRSPAVPTRSGAIGAAGLAAALALSCWRPADGRAAPEAPSEAEDRSVVSDLQSWGLPPTIHVHYGSLKHLMRRGGGPPSPGLAPVDSGFGPERRLELYSLPGSVPTPAGRALREALAGLSGTQLSRVSGAQLEEALRLVELSLFWEGEPTALPGAAEAFEARAREVLAGRGDSAAGLGLSRPSRSTREVLLERRAGIEAALRAPGEESRRERLRQALAAIAHLTGSGDAAAGRPTHEALLALAREVPEQSLSPAQWDAMAQSFPLGRSLSQLRVVRLWRAGETGRGVRVAVIDDGVDVEHPDLRGRAREGFNFTAHRYTDGPRAGELDGRGAHGTHVAGIIHALAPEVEIVSYKVIDLDGVRTIPRERQMSLADMADAAAMAMEAAAREAERDGVRLVVNLSMGFRWPPSDPAHERLLRTVEALARRNVIVVASTGNDGEDAVGIPAASPWAIGVGSVDYAGRQAESSSRAELPEPGPDGGSRLVEKPDILAPGDNVTSARFDPTGRNAPGTEYVELGGTSMAAPHVSAAVALILQSARDRGTDLSFEEVRELLLASADRALEAPYGRGLASPDRACRAVDMAANLVVYRPACRLRG